MKECKGARIKEAENVKSFYLVMGTGDRNMRDISPPKLITSYFK